MHAGSSAQELAPRAGDETIHEEHGTLQSITWQFGMDFMKTTDFAGLPLFSRSCCAGNRNGAARTNRIQLATRVN
jgi:hypothetical protein